ncbi:MAG: ribonuclease HII [Azospirillum brasilense]|nr:MAG: ribonuclease HII [Azospirillum brasilense]
MPDLSLELGLPYARICGVDEAGRGPWAGPVVAAAAMFHDHAAIPPGLNDSKKLSAEKRASLVAPIHACAWVGVGIASVDEIDQLNILNATMLAMARAVEALPEPAQFALVDGNRTPKRFPCPVQTVVKGDARSLSIAAASIIAKVTRDELMHALHMEYPHYGFARHMGYGTSAHSDALRAHGPCPHHRQSFAPIRAMLAEAA